MHRPYRVIETIDRQELALHFTGEALLGEGGDTDWKLARRMYKLDRTEAPISDHATQAEAEQHAAELNKQNKWPGRWFRAERIDDGDDDLLPIGWWMY